MLSDSRFSSLHFSVFRIFHPIFVQQYFRKYITYFTYNSTTTDKQSPTITKKIHPKYPHSTHSLWRKIWIMTFQWLQKCMCVCLCTRGFQDIFSYLYIGLYEREKDSPLYYFHHYSIRPIPNNKNKSSSFSVFFFFSRKQKRHFCVLSCSVIHLFVYVYMLSYDWICTTYIAYRN